LPGPPLAIAIHMLGMGLPVFSAGRDDTLMGFTTACVEDVDMQNPFN
jgi:hypothetical protein